MLVDDASGRTSRAVAHASVANEPSGIVPARAKLEHLESGECTACVCGLTWWAWQPESEVYLGTLAQFVGAILFIIACIIGLPDVMEAISEEEWVEYWFVFTPSLFGGLLFTAASYIGLIEVTHSRNPFAPPEHGYSHGYVVALMNLWGSVLFALAAGFYYLEAPLMAAEDAAAENASGWWIKQLLVRLPYAVGSAMFAVGALFGIHEVLNPTETA